MRQGGAAFAFARRSLVAAAGFVFTLLPAQTPPAPASSAATPATEASSAPASETVERLRFHFSLPPASDPAAPAAAVAASDSETAPPGVVRLPKLEVRDRRIDLEPREVLSEKGRIDAAKQRYLTPAYQQTFGQLSELALLYFNPLALLGGWHPNDAEAMTLYEQDERRRRMRRGDESLDLHHVDDTKGAIKLKELLYDTYRHEQAPSTHGHHDQ